MTHRRTLPACAAAATTLACLPAGVWGEAFGAYAAKETRRWAEVVKASGARLE
jgi:hypothetical protein